MLGVRVTGLGVRGGGNYGFNPPPLTNPTSLPRVTRCEVKRGGSRGIREGLWGGAIKKKVLSFYESYPTIFRELLIIFFVFIL